MVLSAYINVLRRRIWVIAVTLIVTLTIVTAGTFLMTPVYTATSIVRIATASASSVDYTAYQYATLLLNTYVNIATSGPLLDQLSQQLGLTVPPKTSVEIIPNTELIQISIEDKDPGLAVNAANTLANILVSQSSEFYSGGGKTPSEVLKEQMDQALSDLAQDKTNYNLLRTQTPNDSVGINNASKAIDLQQQLYTSLVTQYEQTRTREAIQANLVSIVNPAVLPLSPSRPNKPLNLALGLIVGSVAGIGLAFLFENLDGTLYSSEQITAMTGLRPIGRIPTTVNKEERSLPLVQNTPYGEAFFRLRTNFLKLIEDTSMRSFMISSAIQGEGKSSAISSLAVVLAQSGKRVIIVDCDFRLPTLHHIFDVPNQMGLSDILMGRAELSEIIQLTSQKNLHIITRGHISSDPIQLLYSPRMKILLQALLQRFDLVLFDTPSILAVTDASMIASIVDGVLLVVKKGRVQKSQLEAALQQYSDIKAKVIGLVINGERLKETYYQYSNYGIKSS